MAERERPTLIVFQGPVPEDGPPLERFVVRAQHAATLDLLGCAAQSGAFKDAILVTEDVSLTTEAQVQASGREIVLPFSVERSLDGEFHLGETLREICKVRSLERVVYVGGGALPFVSAHDLSDLALAISGEAPCVMSNNLFSADLVAFYPASALDEIALPATDNDLAWLLHYRAGLPSAATPRSLAMQFDIDTPPDVAVLWHVSLSQSKIARHVADPTVGENLVKVLAEVPFAMPELARNIERAYQVMATRRAQVLLAGRVSSWVWRRLEVNLPCQTRVISEERGMQASGRQARGEARSILGSYADLAGIAGLIAVLGQMCDAAFIDTRVLFAHRHLTVSRPDRFASDALRSAGVSDEWVRELTEKAASATIPIVLGGHSLVSGGVWALSEQVRASASASNG